MPLLMFYHPTLVLVFSSIYDSNLGYDVVSKVVWEQLQQFCFLLVKDQCMWRAIRNEENVLAKCIPLKFKFAINVEVILCETENIILLG